MSIQILPPKTSISGEIGQALAPAIAKGAEQQFQRGLTQQAVSKLGNLPQGATAFDLAKQLISATAGIPGAERYVGQLFPLLLTQLQGRNRPEGQATPRLPGQGEGYLSEAPLTPSQKLDYATQLNQTSGVPLGEGLELANKLAQPPEQALQYIQSQLQAQGITDKELPYATQMAQLSKTNDPNQLIKEVRLGIDELRQMDKILQPGPVRRALQAGVLGEIGQIAAGRETREQAQQRLDPLIKTAVDKGYDPIIREKLGNLGFSPTEIQESLFRAAHKPEYNSFAKSVQSFPKEKETKGNAKILDDFIRKNTEIGVPLLLQRYKLWKDKGYDWKDVNASLSRAMQNGLQLSPDQTRELSEFTSVPPRESLGDIFSDWGRIADVFMGRK